MEEKVREYRLNWMTTTEGKPVLRAPELRR